MEAVALALAIFACWGVVGYALTSWLLPRRQVVPNLLLAPVVGMAALELAAHIALRCGSPVGPVAWPIVAGALLLASTTLAVRRPPFALKRFSPFVVILLVALPLSGWPSFRWGSDWVANANGDMANYCVGATGYREHGFLSMPVEEYLSGRDLTHGAWFMWGDVGTRHGCEMSLAMTSEITSLPVPMIFMPVILASHLVLISATGFLTCRLAGGRVVALMSCALMAVSPLSTYGVVQQLIAQAGGTALLVAATGLFFRPARRLPTSGWVRRGVLGGILAAALMLHYTEVAPFLVLGFGLHLAIGFARGRRDGKQLAVAVLAAILVPVLLGGFLVENVRFLLGQAAHGRGDPSLVSIFPQYLTTEGFARLWGLATLYDPAAVTPGSRWPVHRSVVLGGLCALLCLGAGIAHAWRRRPASVLLLVMLGVAVHLFRTTNAFGLFKLAMFAQPFILGTLALGLVRMNRGAWKLLGLLSLGCLVLLQLSTQYTYVAMNTTRAQPAWTISRGVTRERLLTQIRDALRTPGARRFVVTADDLWLSKVIVASARGVTLSFPHSEPLVLASWFQPGGPYRTPSGRPEASTALERIAGRTNGSGRIALLNRADPTAESRLMSYAPDWVDRPEPGDYLLELPERFTPFNRLRRSAANAHVCHVIPLHEARNYLIWRQSTRSQDYYAWVPGVCDEAGLYSLQYDPAFPSSTMAASGRYLTFQVLQPSPKVRLVLTCTASHLPGNRDLPAAEVVGDRRVQLPLTGIGAARVASEPVAFQTLDTGKYLALDLGRANASPRPGKRGVRTDPRKISVYLRDISAVSEDEYARLAPPRCVTEFPTGLADKHLEFSGCCEDGWVGKRSWFRLSRPAGATEVVVRGMLPQIGDDAGFQTELSVKWNGAEVGRRTIKVGDFEVRLPVPPGTDPGKVELEFAHARPLPAPDERVTGARLKFVGFDR